MPAKTKKPTAKKAKSRPKTARGKAPAAKKKAGARPKSRAAFKKEMEATLTAVKGRLLNELSLKIKSESDAEKKEIGDIYDIASSERERELSLMLGDRDRERLLEIDRALERIGEKDYGLCEECGEPIGQERLRALPFTTVCVDCKSRSEKSSLVVGRLTEEVPRGMLEKMLTEEDEY